MVGKAKCHENKKSLTHFKTMSQAAGKNPGFFQVTSGNLLLDVTFALPLTAIAVDTLESNVFVGAKNGNIHTFSLRAPPRDLNMSIKPDKKNTFKVEF